jgi:L-ascorbate 6-phosphate lactonase
MKTMTFKEIHAHATPRGGVTLWWLGQAGFIIKSPLGQVAALDPYLSNSCQPIGVQHGLNFDRTVPPPLPPGELAGIDLYCMTHSHQDHLDPETLSGYRAAGGHGLYVAPPETVDKLRTLGVPDAEILMIWPNKCHTVGDLTVRATFAIPFSGDDLTHVGYLFSVQNGPTVYFTGDTAYHELLGDAVAPHKPDVLVPVINGAFRNLCPAEAAALAKRIEPKVVIPCHHDLFPDNCQPPQMLRTCLLSQGLADRYQTLEHGVAWDYSCGTFPKGQ